MKPVEIKAAGLTDVGLKRDGNEDSFSADDSAGLYVVADGMGGHLAGEVASRVAVNLIGKSYREWSETETPMDLIFGNPDHSLSRPANYISSSIRLANRVIYEMAIEHEQYSGMGTTVALLLVMPDQIICANAGDSRIYLVRNGDIEMLSKDHTIVAEQVEMGVMSPEEAKDSPMQHVLTKNLGSFKEVSPEVFEIEPVNNDRFVLCSDGLTDLLSDNEILAMVQGVDNPEVLCRNFIDTALKRGGHDNTTVISVFIEGDKRSKPGTVKKVGGLLADTMTLTQKMTKLVRS